MATITELIIAASVDPSGVKRGLDQAVRFSQIFAKDVTTAISQGMASGGGFEQRGAQIVESLIGGMNTRLESAKARLREQLARGLIDRTQFERSGQLAGQAFNEGILASIQKLRADQMLTPGMHQQLVNSLREDGIRAGEAFEQGLKSATGGGTAPGGFQASGSIFSIGGKSGNRAVISAAFALEALAQSGDKAESGLRRVTRAVAMLALAFGPEGALVAGLAIGGMAIADFFHKAEKEAEESRKKLEAEFRHIASGGSIEAASKRAQQLYSGDKYVNPDDPLAKLIQGGGVEALRRQEAALRAQIAAIRRPVGDEGGEAMERYNKAVAPLAEKLAEVTTNLGRIVPEQERVNAIVGQFSEKVGREAVNAAKLYAEQHPFAKTVEDVERLTTAYEQMQKLGLQPTDTMVRSLIDKQRQINALLDQQPNKTSLAANVLRSMKITLDQAVMSASQLLSNYDRLSKVQIPGISTIGPTPRGFTGPDVAALNASLEQRVRGALLLGATGKATDNAEVEARANAERQKAITLIKSMLEGVDAETLSTVAGADAVERLLGLLRELEGTSKKTATIFDDWSAGLQGALDILGSFKNVSRDVLAVGNSLLHTMSSVSAFQKATNSAQSISAGLGIVGGVIGTIGGIATIMQGDKAAREMTNQLLEANNDRLRELKNSLDGTLMSAGRNANAARAVGSAILGVDEMMLSGKGGDGATFYKNAIATVSQRLMGFGLTIQDVADMAKAYGIEIFDKDHNLILPALDQFWQALKKTQQQMLSFTDSFTDRTALRDAHDRIFGKTSDTDKVQASLDLLKQFAPNLFAGLKGADPTTTAGRAQIEAVLQAVMLKIEKGGLSADELAGFEGVKQLVEAMLGLQDGLDGLSKAADAVTASLLNVPTGYKVALARFNATAPLDMSNRAPPLAPGGPTGARPTSFVPMPRGSAASAGAGGPSFNFGIVNIDATGMTPDEIWQSVLKIGKRKARLIYGDSTRWSDVQDS